MQTYFDNFTQRQTMNAPDFEFYHYIDLVPPAIESHYHDFYEVYVFVSGTVRYTIDGRYYDLRPGDILLTNTWDIHHREVFPGKPYERYILWLNIDFLHNMAQPGDDLTTCFIDSNQKCNKLIRPDGETLTHLQNLCRQIKALQKESAFGSMTLLYAALTEFLVYLNRAYFDTPDEIRRGYVRAEDETLNQVIDFIETHMTDQLSLNGLSETFHVSKFHLNAKFKSFTGLTVYQFIMKKRLISARAMLRSGVPVTQASLACGFGDYSNFLKAFKREFGCNPKEFLRH